MRIVRDIAELRRAAAGLPDLAFVPTMGNLHDGHLALVRLGRASARHVAASIFVNRLQFAPHEDFERYPRTFDADCAKLAAESVHLVFAPDETVLYPVPQQCIVEPPPIAGELEGRFRPRFFHGVATVVLKLFNCVQPRVAVFGKKDYQQLHIIHQMVAQLNLPVRIVGGETVRAADGLALSSRNQYLSAAERVEAIFLYQTLQGVRQAILKGERDIERLQMQAVEALVARGWKVDYVAVRNQSDLHPVSQLQANLVILAAAKLGNTRLIDNVEVNL